MADIAVSALTRLKNKAKESGRSYQLCLRFSAKRSFCVVWKSQNMLKILC